MSKKFSIRKVDLDKLDIKIDEYICETDEKNPYIFMCESTFCGIDPLNIFKYAVRKQREKDVAIEYKGYKVFIDNELDFGEIEIR